MALSIEHRRVLQKLALQSVHWVASNPREAAAVGMRSPRWRLGSWRWGRV